jgi:MFS family permease
VPARAPSINPFRVLLTHRNFRIFWIGQTLSLIGTWMQSMAQGWLTLELTNNAFLVGLVASAGSLPILLLSLPAGVLVDRQSKLRLVTIAQSLLLVEAAILWALTASGQVTIHWIIGIALFSGAVSAVEIPARQSMMIDLVGRDDLRDAIALNSSGFNLARIIGPGIGAAVIAQLGLAWCFALNALSYLTVLIGLTMVRLPPWLPVRSATSPLRGILEGIEYMRTTRDVSTLMQIVTVYSLFGVPYIALMPVVARDQLGLGAGGFGVMLSCVGIGGLIGALALAAIGGRFKRGRTLAAASYAFSSLLVIFSLVRIPIVAYVVLLFAGLTMIMNGAVANGLIQSIVPDALRGRIMATYSLVVVGLSQVVGAFAAGAVARGVGVSWAIGGGGAVMLMYTLWVYRRHPEVRQL